MNHSDLPTRSWTRYLIPKERRGRVIIVETPEGDREVSPLLASTILKAWADAVGGVHVAEDLSEDR